MNLYYVEMVFFILFSMGIMINVVAHNDILSRKKKKQFAMIYILTIVATVSEFISVFFSSNIRYNTLGTRMVHYGVRVIELSAIPLLAYMILMVIECEKKVKWILFFLCFNVIIEVGSIFGKFIFYIDQNNMYQRGSWYFLYIAIYALCSIVTVVQCVMFEKKYQSSHSIVLMSILGLMVTGVLVRQFHRQARIDFLYISLVMIFIYIYYVDVLQKSDALTGLLNRGSYMNRTDNMSEDVGILYFDIDNFKGINDGYGHAYGDQCIKTVARKIRQVYGKNGACYRIGGDEFCVILHKNINNVDTMNEKLSALLEKERRRDRRIPQVSIGYAKFRSGKDHIADVVERADENMYEMKKKRKSTQMQKKKIGCE